MLAVVCILGALAPGPFGAEAAPWSDSVGSEYLASSAGTSFPPAGTVRRKAVLVLANGSSARAKTVGAPAKVIVATGYGKPPRQLTGARARMMARRAAEVVAVRNLARKLGSGSRGRFRIRGFRYAHTAYHADGSVTVTVEYAQR